MPLEASPRLLDHRVPRRRVPGGAPLSRLFDPESVALIGASERPGALGTVVMKNLLEAGFEGRIHAVNPKHTEIQGQPCTARVTDIGAPVDLAIIATPARAVPTVLAECGAAGIRAALILSAGFREAGAEGRALEEEVVRVARRHGIRFIGPNCLGVLRPAAKLNASFSQAMAKPGHVALVSQSGAVCTALLDWASVRDIGFSNVVSTGIGVDVDFGEVLDYLLLDPETRAIMLYIEGVHDARRFLSALRAVARAKPIVMMKVGRHAAGQKAAISHTGALVGADDVFSTALERAGVVRVLEYADFFAVAETLNAGLTTEGPRLAIVTNGGGPAVMAADAAADKGLELAQIGETTITALDQVLPEAWSRGNPIDVLGDADAARYAEALRCAVRDPGVDAVLAILIPTALTHPEEVAIAVVEEAARTAKPVLTCWIGDASMRPSWQRFRAGRVPTFRTPEDAIEAFAAMAAHRRSLDLLLQVPEPLRERTTPRREEARRVIERALAAGRRVLDPLESKAVLAAFNVTVLPAAHATSEDEAAQRANALGFPLAIKLVSPDITHKTDVGGVKLGVEDEAGARRAWREIVAAAREARPDARIDGVLLEPMYRPPNGRELMLGVVADPVFGPVVSIGLGGTLVEVLRDRALGLPPLNRYLVERMLDRTKAARYLAEFRGKPPASRDALIDAVLAISDLASQMPWIEELDVNPLVVDEHEARAIDARIVVRPVEPSARPYAHMAIHPYPSEWLRRDTLRDGVPLLIRPTRPEDARLEQRFTEMLSERSRYLRYMYVVKTLSPEMLTRFTQIDYDREMGLVALVPIDGREEQVGSAWYVVNADGRSCEFSVVVADAWRQRGIATRLLRQLIGMARERGLDRMDGIVMRENVGMLALAKEIGFEQRSIPDDLALVLISLDLDAALGSK